MRVPHFAKRSLAILALTALAAGCGKDSNAPDAPFDPAGTSSDIGAMQASFESPAMSSFAAASASMASVLGESPDRTGRPVHWSPCRSRPRGR